MVDKNSELLEESISLAQGEFALAKKIICNPKNAADIHEALHDRLFVASKHIQSAHSYAEALNSVNALSKPNEVLANGLQEIADAVVSLLQSAKISFGKEHKLRV